VYQKKGICLMVQQNVCLCLSVPLWLSQGPNYQRCSSVTEEIEGQGAVDKVTFPSLLMNKAKSIVGT